MRLSEVVRAGDTLKQSRSSRLCCCLAALVVPGFVLIGFLHGSPQPHSSTPGGDSPAALVAQESTPSRFTGPIGASPLEIAASRKDRASQFVGQIEQSCLLPGMYDPSTPERRMLSRLFRIIYNSPLGRELLRNAQERRVLVCFDGTTDLMAYYRAGTRLIGLKPHPKLGILVAYLAHELSHVPQHAVYSDNRYFPAGDLILLRRLREATAEALSTRVAWQLRQSGFPSAWTQKRRDPFYGDIVEAFGLAMVRAGPPGNEMEATKAAFDTWFMSPARLDVYDRMTIGHLERISGDSLGLVPPRRALTHEFLLGLTHMTDGNFVAEFSRLPLTDPFYSGNISARNMSHLDRILEEADQPIETQGISDAMIGAFDRPYGQSHLD